jgi:hypothetical protein
MSRLIGQRATYSVVGIEIANHPTTTVKKHEKTKVGVRRRPIKPAWNATCIYVTNLKHHFLAWNLPSVVHGSSFIG